jgi:glycosyltransferase involved in cell wall biosynthesis
MTRIYYACFAHDRPHGGIKVIYRHVDMLNRAGIESYVFHPRERFRVRWFENETPIVGPRALARHFDTRRDVLVLPEDLVALPAGRELVEGPGHRVIFNQNVFFGFGAMGTVPPARSPYRRASVRAVFTVSEHNAALLRLAFPGVRVLRLRLGVDPERFQFRPITRKRRQIAAAMKAPLSMLAIRHIIRARARGGPLHDYRWVFLDRLTEIELASTLEASLVTLFCGIEEGFGLVPLEAMMTGSVVAAFAGGPADEFLPARYRFAPGDIAAVVHFMERVATLARDRPDTLDRWTRHARARAAAYTLDAEERSLLAAWATVLSALPRARART